MITVLIISYNHKDYLSECINSVLNQKTDFKFIIKIFDDFSTDGSQQIIKEFYNKYPDKIEIFLREKNVGYVENIYNAIANNVKSKYFCILEADDKWCDNQKLQIQYNSLEQNSQCSFCAHDTIINNPSSGQRTGKDGSLIFKDNFKGNIKDIFKFEDLLSTNMVGDLWCHTSSRLYRYELIDFSKLKFKETIVNDVCLFFYFFSKGNMIFIDKNMSIYNYTGEGLSSSSSPKKSADFLLDSLIKINIDLDFKYKNEINKFLINHKFIDEIILFDIEQKAITEGLENVYNRLLKNNNIDNKATIPVLTCFDKNYILPGVVAFYSMLENADKNYFYKIYVLCSDINLENQYKMEYSLSDFKNFSIEFVDMKNKFDNLWNKLQTKAHFSKEVFYKLLSASIFPNYEKIIITDVDVVFLGDIAPSYNQVDVNLEYYLWSVKPVGKILGYYDNPQYKNNFSETEISNLKASCGGYLIMNLKKIRENKIEEKFLKSFETDGHRLNQAEQDILNLVCADKIKFLHLKYLVCSYIYNLYKTDNDFNQDLNYAKQELIEAYKNPVQLHYATGDKPWKNPKTVKAEIWYFFLSKTIYFNYFNNKNTTKHITPKFISLFQGAFKISRKRKIHFKILKEKI